MPRCGTLFGTKRLFEAKRADKHAALRVDLRHNNIFSGERTVKCTAQPDNTQYKTAFSSLMYCKMYGTAGHPAVQSPYNPIF